MTPLTVLMTAYNREAYLGTAIESVLAQRFGDFHLIVVDDRSTDGTRDITERFARLDRRVRVEANPRNLGDYANRNRAARLVETAYFKFHDSDDVMYPHCLEVMMGYLTGEPAAGFAVSAHRAWPGGPCPMLLTPRLAYEREFLGEGLFMVGPAGLLFRTAAFRAVGGFDEVGPHSDMAFWLKACRRLSVLLVPGDLYWYRVHEGQHLASAGAAFDAADPARWAWEALGHPECPLDAADRVQARRNLAVVNGRRLWRLARRGQWRAMAHQARRCGLTAADWVRYLRRPRRSAVAGTPPRP